MSETRKKYLRVRTTNGAVTLFLESKSEWETVRARDGLLVVVRPDGTQWVRMLGPGMGYETGWEDEL